MYKPSSWYAVAWYAGMAVLLLWFGIGGVMHFTHSARFLSIMPPAVPWPLAVVWFTGVCELAAVMGLLFARLRRLTGWLLILFVICVTPANVYMWQNAELFPVPESLLLLRLPLQLLLVALIWWVACRPSADA